MAKSYRPARHKRTGKPLGMQDVSRVMDIMMNTTGIGRQVSEKELMGRWGEVVGEQIAQNVKLLDIQNGWLILKTESSVWKNEINLRKKSIFQRSNEVLGKSLVRGLRFL